MAEGLYGEYQLTFTPQRCLLHTLERRKGLISRQRATNKCVTYDEVILTLHYHLRDLLSSLNVIEPPRLKALRG
jgi:hypothetical protein